MSKHPQDSQSEHHSPAEPHGDQHVPCDAARPHASGRVRGHRAEAAHQTAHVNRKRHPGKSH